MMSLGWLGRFAEAAAYEAEIIRLAQAAGHANTIGWAQCAAGTLHMLRGDRAKARGPFETFLAEVRPGNVGVMLPPAMAFSAWSLAQFGETAEALERLRVTEQLSARTGGERLDRPDRLVVGPARVGRLCAGQAGRSAAPGRPCHRLLAAPARLRRLRAPPARRHRGQFAGVRRRARARPAIAQRWRSPNRAACAR
jgi:hypothetical protein